MKTVAVLDDEQSLVELYQTFLGEEGYRVTPVVFSRDLPTVVENIRSTEPTLLILDVHLPGLGSFEILQELQADSQLLAVPVLVCSASRPSLNALQEMIEKAGLLMPKTMEKPFDLDEMVNMVVQLIGPA